MAEAAAVGAGPVGTEAWTQPLRGQWGLQLWAPGPHLMRSVSQSSSKPSPNNPRCSHTAQGGDMVKACLRLDGNRTAGENSFAAELLFLSSTTEPSHKKNAAALVSMQGDTTAMCMSMSWAARYSTQTTLTTLAQSLPSLLQVALYICMRLSVGVCYVFRLSDKLGTIINVKANNCITQLHRSQVR